MYKVIKDKEQSFLQLKLLVAAFEKEYSVYKTKKYSEAQLRIDFINPLLKTFGWDVDNEETKSQFLRDIIQEEAIDVEEDDVITKKNPDYTIRIQGIRKVFIEAKKVSVDIISSPQSAFQTRRYGWNANLGISILTNFENLVVYDCRYKPIFTDDSSVARYSTIHFSKYLENFENLYKLLSFESIAGGYIDEYFSITQNNTNTFDEYFLKQIETWRCRLAIDIIQNNKGLNDEGINFLVQRLLNRIIFLRICEDREIEKYATLKSIKSYDELKNLFLISDKKYNSGLFDFIEDNFSLNLNLKSENLILIFNELYYPESSYDFSVVDPTILSHIYERYLGSKIHILNNEEISIIEEPEIAASNGVVPTPKSIAKKIVKETLDPIFLNKNSEEIQSLKIADICCGSGTFLLSIYDYLIEQFTLAYIKEQKIDTNVMYQGFDGRYILTLKTKQSFLLNNIYGVDINPYATEVCKFSLSLKLLENENAGSIENYLAKYKQKVLPNLDKNIKNGNSLIDNNYFQFDPEAINNNELLYKIKPFNWTDEFVFLKKNGGFDAIVGNPPYVRIQNMVKYLKGEIKYYQNTASGYTVAEGSTFDKYYLFIQRAVQLLNSNGVLGYIIPNKFFIIKSGETLRKFISENSSIFKIIHFGVTQVFPNRSTYTVILILDKKIRNEFEFKRIKNISTEFLNDTTDYTKYENKSFGGGQWIFLSENLKSIFEKINSNAVTQLKTITDISVGLQTSNDSIYIIVPLSETEKTYKFKRNDIEYEIEKLICKPCIYDCSFELFDSILPNAQIIFPYNILDDKAEVFSEEHFQDNFPLTWNYLNSFKDILSKRSISGGKDPKWYQYGRSQSLIKFHNTSKIIWPVLSTGPNYIYDNANLQFTGGGNGPYYSFIQNSEYSLFYILGIISHPLFEAMVKIGASEFRGEYYSHGKQFIENLPIKQINFSNSKEKEHHDEIVNLVKEVILTKNDYNQESLNEKRKVLKRKIDFLNTKLENVVNQLYGITDDEVSIGLDDALSILIPPEL